MAKPKVVTISLPNSGINLEAPITDEDAYFFLTFLFNDEEREINRQGNFPLANQKFSNRLKEIQEQEQEDPGAGNILLGQQLIHAANSDRELRANIIYRFKEIFGEQLPDQLVCYVPGGVSRLRLSIEDQLTIIVGIVGNVFVGLTDDKELASQLEQANTASSASSTETSKERKGSGDRGSARLTDHDSSKLTDRRTRTRRAAAS